MTWILQEFHPLSAQTTQGLATQDKGRHQFTPLFVHPVISVLYNSWILYPEPILHEFYKAYLILHDMNIARVPPLVCTNNPRSGHTRQRQANIVGRLLCQWSRVCWLLDFSQHARPHYLPTVTYRYHKNIKKTRLFHICLSQDVPAYLEYYTNIARVPPLV